MTDLAARVLRPEQNDHPVRSLMDVDFYKPTMSAYAAELHPGITVKFSLINRNRNIPVARIVPEDELRAALDHALSLRVRRTDTYYLAGMDIYGRNMFSPKQIKRFAELKLPPYSLRRVGDQYELSVEGEWSDVTFWETIAMAAIMELYFRSLMRRMSKTEIELLHGAMDNKLYRKLKRIAERPDIRISDFSTRRRQSFLRQKRSIEMAKNVLGDQFSGTSNTYLAFAEDLVPIGTNAHELPMVLTALANAKAVRDGVPVGSPEHAAILRSAQYDVLREWSSLYGTGLRVVLPDTYGSAQFFSGMPDDLADEIASSWRGMRQDSGDPIAECEGFIRWLASRGVSDPVKAGKICIFSDGLDVKVDGYGAISSEPDIIELHDAFRGRIITPFGWGTNLANDPRGCLPEPDGVVPGLEDLGLRWTDVFKGFSLVCKVAEVSDGKSSAAAVKLSNNYDKATGPKDAVDVYRAIFGESGAIRKDVIV